MQRLQSLHGSPSMLCVVLLFGSYAAMCVSITSCADSSSGTSRVTSRDSAGVLIIENSGDLWATLPRWQLSDAPVLRIGAAPNEGPYLFEDVIDISVLSDGRIVVADRGSGELRWFDAGGTFLFARGGSGSGPGEFRQLRTIAVGEDDNVVAFDPTERRLTSFAVDGTVGPVIRMVSLPGATSSRTADRLASGSWVVGATGVTPGDLPEDDRAGIVRTRVPLVLVAPDGARTDTIGVFPAMELEVSPAEDGRRLSMARFAKRLSYAVLGNLIAVGTADHLEVNVHSPDGSLVRSIRAPDVDLTLTPELQAEYTNYLRARDAGKSQTSARLIDDMILPQTIPAYSALLVDESDCVWVAEYRYDLAAPRRYLVFDSDGRFLSVVAMPERFTPRTITHNMVLGVMTDSLDVEYVVGFSLRRL